MALGQALSQLGASCLLTVRQRLELASLDAEEEFLRLLALLAAVLAAALLLTLALASFAAAVVAFFWDDAPLVALVGVSAFFALAGAGVVWRVRLALRTKPRFMASTIAALKKDEQQLGPQP